MTEILQALISFLKDASPVVWSTLLRQAHVEAMAKLAWSVLFLAVSITQFKVVQIQKARYDEEWSDGKFLTDSPWALLYAGVVVTSIVFFYFLVNSIMWFSNPEFYAIRWLLYQIGGQ